MGYSVTIKPKERNNEAGAFTAAVKAATYWDGAYWGPKYGASETALYKFKPGDAVSTVTMTIAAVNCTAITNDGDFLYVGDADGDIRSVAADGTTTLLIGGAFSIKDICYDSVNNCLYAVSSNGNVVYKVTGGGIGGNSATISRVPFIEDSNNPQKIQINEGGTRLYVLCGASAGYSATVDVYSLVNGVVGTSASYPLHAEFDEAFTSFLYLNNLDVLFIAGDKASNNSGTIVGLNSFTMDAGLTFSNVLGQGVVLGNNLIVVPDDTILRYIDITQ